MKPKKVLSGDLVRANMITRDDVVELAKKVFDGKRSLPVGDNGCRIVFREFSGLTKHLQECLITMLLTSEGVPIAGVDVPEVEDAVPVAAE